MIIEIGGIAIDIASRDSHFDAILRDRYGNFETAGAENPIVIDVEMSDPSEADADLSVVREGAVWHIDRGDFHAAYDASSRRGKVRQTANPWSIDALIRIVHSLELVSREGFLLHAASAIRQGRAFVFTGISGAGKTTISRLAPPETQLLTDEISYLRFVDAGWKAWGTPFAGELGIPGASVSAPVAALCFLEHGEANRLTPIQSAGALHRLMRNILFFAQDPMLVQQIFETAGRLLAEAPVYRLGFRPDNEVWNLIDRLP